MVACYIEDILINTKDEKQHLQTLGVLRKLEKHEFWLKPERFAFIKPFAQYLGHLVDQEGIHHPPSKMAAIIYALAPRGKDGLSKSRCSLIFEMTITLVYLVGFRAILHKKVCKKHTCTM